MRSWITGGEMNKPTQGAGRAAWALLALWTGIEISSAQTYPGIREFGDPVAGAGARSVAMGSTGLARPNDPAGLRINPAAGGGRGREISLSLGPALLTEKRALSAAETRFHEHAYWQINEASVLLSTPAPRVWFGLSAAPEIDFHYETSFTLYDAAGLPSSENSVKAAGALWALSPFVGGHLGGPLSVGAAVDVWTGRERLSVDTFGYGTGVVLDLEESARYRGAAPRAGLVWRGEKVHIGAAVRPPARLRRAFRFSHSTAPARNVSGTDSWTLPLEWGLGLSYQAPGDHATELAVELRQTLWSRMRVNGRAPASAAAPKPLIREWETAAPGFGMAPVPRNYTDTTEISLGVEHGLKVPWLLRYGIRHEPFFADRSVEGTFFSAGLGYERAHGVRWSLALEFGKRDYIGENLLLPAAHRTDETLRRLLVSAVLPW
jgi:hypothetical protein